MKKLSVLMPVYNESRTLRTIVQRVLDSPVDLEIELVCVDDCSKDNSLAILRELEAEDLADQGDRPAGEHGQGQGDPHRHRAT